MSFKRMCLALVAGLLASLALAVPASASDTKAVVLALGEAKTSDKVTGTGKGVRLVGGAGYYTFASLQVTTVGVVKGVPAVAVFEADSQGYFHNTVCGTGKAVKTANVLKTLTVDTAGKGAAYYGGIIAGLDYAVEFVGTKGAFYADQNTSGVKDLAPDKEIEDPKPGEPSADYDLAGFVSLQPPVLAELDKPGAGGPKPGPNVVDGNCTKAFNVAASFVYDS